MTHHVLPAATGGFWYLGCRLADPDARDLVDHVDLLRIATALARARWPFDIDCAVVLPGTVQMIWRLPPGDDAVAARWRLIRSAFTRGLVLRDALPAGPRGLWAQGAVPHPIRDAGDLALYRHLCATAPVRAGLVRRAGDWPHSSVHQRPRHAVLRSAGPPAVGAAA